MDAQIFSSDIIATLQKHLRVHRNRVERPILVFSCGGDEKSHPSRRLLQEYVELSESPCLNNVFFLKAENIACDPSMENVDLLTQEALVADIADWLIIFAESVGSFCELGAFAALPHAAEITSVVVDKRYENSQSFLMNGPVKVIESNKSPLAEVFFANLECPMESAKLAGFVHCVREKVKQSEDGCGSSAVRKPINNDASKLLVGSFAHELLDLVTLFGPISETDVIELYCEIKKFDARSIRFVSPILEADMRHPEKINTDQIIATMISTGILGKVEDNGANSPLCYSKVPLEDYFMFKGTSSKDFREARARVLLKRRSRGRFHEKNLYQRFD